MADAKDRWHPEALKLRGRLRGSLTISDLALAETTTVVGHRKGGKPSQRVYEFIIDNCNIEFLDSKTLPEVFREFLTYDGTMSVADAHSVWLMRSLGIREILSFDADFDRVRGIERVH